MDKNVIESLATDKTLSNSPFMNILRSIHELKKNEESGQVSNQCPDIDVEKRFFEVMTEIRERGSFADCNLDFLEACFSRMQSKLSLANAELRFAQSQAVLLTKMYEKTEEGKEALDALKNGFSDSKSARAYVLKNGWAKTGPLGAVE